MAKLYFRYGAMNSGKSSLLMQVAYNYEEQGKKVLVVKHIIDKKGATYLKSRIGLKRKVDILLEDDLVSDSLKKVDCILVDEVQFLSVKQIEDLWKITKEKNIPVICYGLKTDFRSYLFEGSKRLIELADSLEELITICKCGKKARFNARVSNDKYLKEGSIIAIDEIDASYEPMCGLCYLKKVFK